MTWTYSGIPLATPLDEIRVLSGMTDVKNQLVSDEEIEYALTQFSNKYLVALLVCDFAKAKFIAQHDCTVGDLSINNSQILNNIREKCEQLKHATSSVIREINWIGACSNQSSSNVAHTKLRSQAAIMDT